jgi:hypothetical protein
VELFSGDTKRPNADLEPMTSAISRVAAATDRQTAGVTTHLPSGGGSSWFGC